MIRVILVFAFACSVLASTNPSVEEECPFSSGAWKDSIKKAEDGLGISILDLADGNILEKINILELVDKCRQKKAKTEIFPWLEIILETINRCEYDATKPRLDAFNIDGVMKAYHFICDNSTNIGILENKYNCYIKSKDKMKKCKEEEMALVGETDDIMREKCSLHRIHEFCAQKVLQPECGSDMASIKAEIANLIIPPACDCNMDTTRQAFTDERSKDCMKEKQCWTHLTEGTLMESEIHNGVLLGARSVEMIQLLCERGPEQDAIPKIADLIGTCFDRGSLCTYKVTKYKLLLINLDGMKSAANLMCENYKAFDDAESCIDDKIGLVKSCIDDGFRSIRSSLEAAGKWNDTKAEVCRKHVQINACINEHFGKCNSDVYEVIKEMQRRRLPRMCDCKKIGYDPNGSAATFSHSVIYLQFSVMLAVVYTLKSM